MTQSLTIPSPPAFLDPLTEIYACHFYAVPRFYPLQHANTRWLLAILRTGFVDKMKRKMELQPSMFRATYYQLLDDPQRMDCHHPEAHSLFHKQSVLYLTVVGMAIYFRSKEILKLLVEYKDSSEEPLYSMQEPQYATHVLDTTDGDFHAFPLSIMIMRGGFYKCAAIMLDNGWNPQDPICMPIRRCYERRAYYYHDWLDYALCLMYDKPLLPIAHIVFHIIHEPSLYNIRLMPLTLMKSDDEGNHIPTGLMNVEELPEDARMIGTKSLMEVAEDYSTYRQIKQRYLMVKDCLRQMVCDGVDPEMTMASALDYDGFIPRLSEEGSTENDDEWKNNASNNNATAANPNLNIRRKALGEINPKVGQGPYISEPTRVLLHALQMGTKPGAKTSLNQLLDSVSVYVRRNVYIIVAPKQTSDLKDGADEMQFLKQRYKHQKRDARNAIILLLNLMQLQIDKLDKLNRKLRSTKERKFKHLDVGSHVFSKRLMITRIQHHIRDLLLFVLLHSGEFVHFIEACYPPYSYHRTGDKVDYPLCSKLEHTFRNIQLEIMADFSTSETAAKYLDHSTLYKAARIKELYLNFRVGSAPKAELVALAKRSRNISIKSSRNASNLANSVSGDASASVQLTSNDKTLSEGTTLYRLLSGEAANYIRNATERPMRTGGRVTFLKVKLKPKRPEQEKGEEKAAKPANTEEPPVEPPKAEEPAAELAASPRTGGDLAFRLAEQIAELGRCAQTGTDVTPKLVAIYNLLLTDLSYVAWVTAARQKIAAPTDAGPPDVAAVPDQKVINPGQNSEWWEEQKQEQKQTLEQTLGQTHEQTAETQGVPTPDKGTLSSGSRGRKAKRARGDGRKPWRCGARTGGRKGHQQPPQQRYQKARVFEAPPGGTEFALDSN